MMGAGRWRTAILETRRLRMMPVCKWWLSFAL
jgi:hypothetical protein